MNVLLHIEDMGIFKGHVLNSAYHTLTENCQYIPAPLIPLPNLSKNKHSAKENQGSLYGHTYGTSGKEVRAKLISIK